MDDGSSDNTLDVLDTLKNDFNFKIVTKTNGGLSSARNAGWRVASGTYVKFLDADDTLFLDTIEQEVFYSQNSTKKNYASEILQPV